MTAYGLQEMVEPCFLADCDGAPQCLAEDFARVLKRVEDERLPIDRCHQLTITFGYREPDQEALYPQEIEAALIEAFARIGVEIKTVTSSTEHLFTWPGYWDDELGWIPPATDLEFYIKVRP